MKIESLLTEAEISDEFSESLEARDIPEKFFYWQPLSVHAWLALAKHVSYESRLHSWNLLIHDAEKVASQFDSTVAVIGLGAGDGSKDLLLLKSLEATKTQVEYFPVDASQMLLEMACAGAEDADIDTLGLKADISSPVHLVLAADASAHQKLFVLCGNTLGGFDPLDQIRCLNQCMHPQDRLIIDGELQGEGSLAARDHAVGHRFAVAPLAGIGISRDDGEVRFEHKRDERSEGLHLITRYFHLARDLRLTLPEREVILQRGERVNLSFNYVYSPEAFRWLLTSHGGLRILEEFISPDGRYLTALCAKR